jgi:LysW-gamma-L-lysine carboxypeptidase
MLDCVDAQIAWRLPLGVEAEALAADLITWTATHLQATLPTFDIRAVLEGQQLTLAGDRTASAFRFRGWEKAWRSDRQNALVRSFLTAIRTVDGSVQPGFLVKTGTSDMNVVGPLWRCPIVAYGPGDSALDHTPHEHLSLDEYWRAIEVMEAMLRTLAASARE